MKIGLVAEIKWEVREVCRRLKLQLLDARDEIWGAQLNGHTIRLCLSGMVPAIAKERVDRFLGSHNLDLMIGSGLAGALRPNIVVGDVVVQSADEGLTQVAGSALKERGIPFHVGPLVTVSSPVLTPGARRELALKSNAIAVDMESQTIAALCRERGIPFLAMKGVSDGVDDDLSPILGGFDIINIPRIAMRVVSRPSTWPLAARLARHSYVAADHLGQGVWATLTRIK
jgi:adenosylhomocysteine nucleosidase